MRNQQFPLYLGDLFSEIIFIMLYERLENYLKSGRGAVPPEFVMQRLEEFRRKYREAAAHFGNTCVDHKFSSFVERLKAEAHAI